MVASPAIVDPNIATLPPSQFLQLLLERCCPGLSFGIALGKIREHADPPHPVGLLRTRCEPPRNRSATEERDELAPSSIIDPHLPTTVRGPPRLLPNIPNPHPRAP